MESFLNCNSHYSHDKTGSLIGNLKRFSQEDCKKTMHSIFRDVTLWGEQSSNISKNKKFTNKVSFAVFTFLRTCCNAKEFRKPLTKWMGGKIIKILNTKNTDITTEKN